MAVIQGGASPFSLLQVDPTHLAQRVSMRPMDHGAFGHYRYAAKSGTLAATLAANAVIFAFRNGSSTANAIITHLRVRFHPNVAFTAAAANLSLAAYIGRGYTLSHAGGTPVTSSGNNLKVRTDFATSQINTNGDIRIATTAAFTSGTVAVDTQPFAYGGPGRANNVNAAAGTEYIEPYPIGTIDYQPRISDGEYPLLLEQNEGFLIRNEVVWPAAGTGEISVEVGWIEVATTII